MKIRSINITEDGKALVRWLDSDSEDLFVIQLDSVTVVGIGAMVAASLAKQLRDSKEKVEAKG